MPVALHASEAGEGLPLVLLHPFPLSSAAWDGVRDRLAEVCRVVTPDQRGFGQTPLGPDEPDLDLCADDVVALLDRLGLERVVLGGMSMGGYVAMATLRRHPDRVRALVLADTKAGADAAPAAANRRQMADRLEQRDGAVLLEQVLPALLGPTTTARRPQVVEAVRALVERAAPGSAAWAQRAMAARLDAIEVLRGTDLPALVVVGDEDALSPPDEAAAMADALPQGRLVVLEGAGHLTALEVPDAFADAVSGFLREL